eukprot:Tbor_TRINITY_DN5249_c0_g4::TRINITY_DN5249_c0_g4_i1::g.16782::m.16782
MGNEQGKPSINRNSEEYVAAKGRFHVITGEKEIITEKKSYDKEADRLLQKLDALGPPMPPLLPSSLENSILKSKKDLAVLHELEGVTYGGSKKCPVPIRKYTPVTVSVDVTSIEKCDGNAISRLLPPPPMQTDGVEASSFYQLMGISQTFDRREGSEILSLQESILSSLAHVKYATQHLRYDYNQLLNESQALDNGLKKFLGDLGLLLGELGTPGVATSVSDASHSSNSTNSNIISMNGTIGATVADIAALVLEIDAYIDPEERENIQNEVEENLAKRVCF